MAAKALTTYQSLIRQVKADKIAPLYVFYGEEQVLARYVVSVIAEQLFSSELASLNVVQMDGQKLDDREFIQAVETPPMFAERRLVVVNRPSFLKQRKEPADALSELFQNWPAYTCVVLLATEADKRLKLVRQIWQSAVVGEFPALTGPEAAEWVEGRLKKSGVKSPYGTGRRICDRAGTDLELLRLEVDKLVTYSDGGELTEDDIIALVSNNAETSVFDLVDALGHRQLPHALRLLGEMLQQGQEPLYLLAMIVRQLRLLLLARHHLDAGLSADLAARQLGIHPFPAGKCVSQAHGWKTRELQRAMDECLATDEAIKTGEMRGERALDALVISLISAG